jgi:hypothetical protein
VPPFNRKTPLIGNRAEPWDTVGEKAVIIRRLIVPLTFAAVALHVGQAFAQGAFPAPLTGQDAAASTNGASPVPPDGASDDCLKGLAPLRVDAEKRGKLIKAASERQAPPEEACRLIESFGQFEIKMIKYVEANSAKCGMPPQIGDQLKAGLKNTEAMLHKVCAMARGRGPAGPVGDFDDIGAGNL